MRPLVAMLLLALVAAPITYVALCDDDAPLDIPPEPPAPTPDPETTP